MQKENKILLHSCCAICSAYPISFLKDLGFSPLVFFCNPNIDTETEYNRRLTALEELCSYYDVELIVDKYKPKEYLDYILGYESEPEKGLRCDKCIELRLLKTAEKAKELGVFKFTSTLPISPHKNFVKISEIGNAIASRRNVEFIAYDFKKKDGFLKTNKISKELNLYRQNYCGCKFAK